MFTVLELKPGVLAVKLLIRSGLFLASANERQISSRRVVDMLLVPEKLKRVSFGLAGEELVPCVKIRRL